MPPQADIELRPQPGFQDQVLAAKADVVIAGGAAGCGKSWCSVVDPLRWVHISGYSAIIFRRTYAQLTGGGSVWELSQEIYPQYGGRSSGHTWRFPSGAVIQFSHLQHAKNRLDHQSKQYATIIFEELTHFESAQFWYLMSRLRSTCGVRPYLRATCNPDADSFVAEIIAWYLDSDGYADQAKAGKLRYFARVDDKLVWADARRELPKDLQARARSFQYIPGKLNDNAILCEKDPNYRSWLESQPLVDRLRLLGGNWAIRPAAGLYFKREYFTILDETPSACESEIRFWDKAATPFDGSNDPSWTVGIRMAKLADGSIIIRDIVRLRGTPAQVDKAMLATASQDGYGVRVGFFQDPGQAGVVDRDHVTALLQGYRVTPVKITQSKLGAAGPLSAHAESKGLLLTRANWNDSYIAELCGFPDARHNDQVDATSGAFNLLSKPALYFA